MPNMWLPAIHSDEGKGNIAMTKKSGIVFVLIFVVALISTLSAATVLAKGGNSAFVCTGLIVAGDVKDSNVIVPNGSHCGIDGTVNGNIFVEETGSLTVGIIGIVNGNIQSDSIATTSLLGVAVDVFGIVNGNVTQRGDGSLSVVFGTVTGNVRMTGDGRLQVSAIGVTTNVDGNVVNEGTGDTFVGSGIGGTLTVGGHVMAKGDGGGDLTDEFVSPGSTSVGNSVCGLTLSEKSPGSVVVGGKFSDECSPRN